MLCECIREVTGAFLNPNNWHLDSASRVSNHLSVMNFSVNLTR